MNYTNPILRFPSQKAKDYNVQSLASLASKDGMQTGPFGSQLKASEYVESDEGVPVIMPKDLFNGSIMKGGAAKTSPRKAESLKRHQIKFGDILFARRGELGRIAVVKKEEAGFLCGTGCLRFRPNFSKVNPIYLGYLIGQPKIIEWLETNAVGQTMLNLNTKILGNLPISAPDLEEQKYIADFLSTIDHKIAYLLEHKSALIRFKVGLKQKLFSQELRFQQDGGEDFPDWEEAVLPEVAHIRKGKQLSKTDMKGGVYPVMNGSLDPVGWHDEPNREAGGIAMTQGGKCGQVRFMDTPYWSGGDSFEIRPQSVHPSYLFYWLQMNQKYFEDLSTGGALKHLSKDVVTEFVVPLPSGPEQAKIGEALAAMDAKIDAIGKEISLMETFKKGLLQQMFV